MPALLGFLAWAPGGVLALGLLLPAIALSAPRRSAAVLSASCFACGAAWRIVPAALTFSGSLVAGVGALALYAAAYALPYGMLWSLRAGAARRFAATVAILAVQLLPPFGFLLMLPHLAGAGDLFPGTGWVGLSAAAAIAGLAAAWAPERTWWPVGPTGAPRVAALVLTGALLGMLSVAQLHAAAPSKAGDWQGISTRLGALPEPLTWPAFLERQQVLMALALQAVRDGARVVLLPENAAGPWSEASEKIWRSTREAVAARGAVLLMGAQWETGGRFEKGLRVIGAADGALAATQPVPIFEAGLNWRWSLDPPTIEVAGRRTGAVVCYEALTALPVMTVASRAQVMTVAINAWWDTTDTARIQVKAARSWAALFGVPIVVAVNR